MRKLGQVLLLSTLGAVAGQLGGCRADAQHLSGASGSASEAPESAAAGEAAATLACKRGLAVANEVTPHLSAADLAAIGRGVHWWYNWSPVPLDSAVAEASIAQNVAFLPLVFTAPKDASTLAAQIDVAGGYLLGFNEPNFTAQGNLTPQAAAAAWPALERIADAHSLKLVSPALNYCGGGCNLTDPFAWLDAFFAACANCRIDAVAIHAYVCDAGALKKAYLEPFAQRYGKPLWVTELACLDGSKNANDPNVQLAYMTEAVATLEADPNVARYAWFLARASDKTSTLALLGDSGELTPLGAHYVALPAACDANGLRNAP